jgi:hypothetical protein
MPCEKPGSVFRRVYFGRILCVILVQRVIFFISQIRHRLLLILYQRQKDITAPHRMEYFKSIIINNIVQDFKKIGISVKANKQVPGVYVIFSITVVQPFIIQNIVKRHAYIRFGNLYLARQLPRSKIEHET